ncbi:unnamed protein product [Caenorhabditis auriculariae]|uniref:CC domain-containing protein n=1 Tax=Caenorhabditis auriculariae TaxID=2777116 RepID=A0A8S1HVZ4_9PELO|nr:unnamed protein product [Caenorhabditis auriculariae]
MTKSLALLIALVVLAVTVEAEKDIFARAVGPCIEGKCQTGHACYKEQCIPRNLVPRVKRDAIFGSAVGPCILGRCQAGHACYMDQCLPQGLVPNARSPRAATAIGPCVNLLCPKGHVCRKNQCFPQ